MVETVDSVRIATALDNAWEKLVIPNKEPLKVLVQVNTSNEDGKFCCK